MQFTFPFSRKNKNKKSRAARTPCRPRPAVEILEDRCLLDGTPFPMPYRLTGDLPFFNGVTGDFVKTITFTNNNSVGGKTVYPFIEGENTRQAIAPYQGTSAFDPYDPNNHEYRGYLGYTDGNMNFFAGVQPQTSITFTVPLAFWDSGRIHFSTDPKQFASFNSKSPPGAPFNFLQTDTQAIFLGDANSATPTQLNFTPIYNSFDSSGTPVTTSWQSPVASGLFTNGQQLKVTGPGIPDNYIVTIDSSHPNYVTLPAPGITINVKAGQYTFQVLNPDTESIAPTDRYIQQGFNLATTGGSATQFGVVMWYHSLVGQQPNNDAPDQLFESSFKGTFYDKTLNPGTGFEALVGSDVYKGVIENSADYDLSFVDSINLPIALEATNTLIPNTNNHAPFGWVGSDQTVADFQTALQDFASGKLTGTYFSDGRGWPSYLTLIDPGNLKLPSGQNLFLASPAVPPGTPHSGAVSDIQYFQHFDDSTEIRSPLYALSTGGDGPSILLGGGDPSHPSEGNFLGLNTTSGADKAALVDFILPNTAKGFKYIVTYDGGTKTAGIVKGPWMKDGELVGVELDRTAPTDSSNVYTFSQSKIDYAAGGIAGLWYTWAKYYAEHVTSTAMPASGSISNGNILTLDQAAPKDTLVPGMAVTGATVGQVPPGCVILSISPDRKTIHLSTTATGTSFNFAKPSFDSLKGYDKQNPEATPLVNLKFDADTPAQKAFALAFSETVYTVMSAWGPSVKSADNGWVQLMASIVGGLTNTDFLPNGNVTDITNLLTVLSKSVLRGVPDYTSSLYSDPAQWYPDPALPAGGLTYNAFNLLPYVWFVHEKLGLTAYAFALDDDIGNVMAGGADHVDMAVGGLTGLPNGVIPNRDPYTNQSHWGVVMTGASNTTARSSEIGGLTNTNAVQQIGAFDYDHSVAGAVINGPGVPTGTTVQFTNINPNPALTTVDLSNPLTTSSTSPTLMFFGPLTFTGTVLGAGQSAGDTIFLTSEDAFNTLNNIGPLGNIRVAGEGIAANRTVTVKQVVKDNGHFVVQLVAQDGLPPLDPKLVSLKGTFYAYTFGTSVIPVVRDPGFEWRGVEGKAPGNFLHGKNLSDITPDWTFTDGSGTLFAGIAFDNNSTYTTGNPQAPQGLQVGFVQGGSSISQNLTLGAGQYNLTLLASQRAGQQTSQSLDVMLDNTKVGTINPGDTTYKLTTIPFTVETPGKHTITFKGTQAGDSTVLLDAIQASPVSAQALTNQSPGAPSIGAGSPTQVAQDPYALFVQKLYHNVLKRPPSAAGLKRWTSFLRSGGLRRAVAVALVTKPEYLEAHPDATSFVKGLYHDVLYRLPRPQRLATWLEFAQAHPNDWVALAQAIMNQPEAIMRLRELFQQANHS